MNPYWGKDFLGFFFTLFERVFLFMTGRGDALFSDELQLLILGMLSLSCGLIGAFLLLRKMSMLANSLSHTVLLGIVITCILFRFADIDMQSIDLKILMGAALISALLTAGLTELFTKLLRLQEDASIGLVFTGLFSLGVILVTLYTSNSHIGPESVMGNVDALHISDLKSIFFILMLNVAAVALFYRQFQITSFDPVLAKTLGISVTFFHYLLLFLCSATVIGAFRAVGVILVLAFLVGPFLTARLLSHKLKHILFLSPLLGISASLIGVALSRHFLSVFNMPLSTGSIVVLTIAAQFVAVLTYKSLRKSKLIKA